MKNHLSIASALLVLAPAALALGQMAPSGPPPAVWPPPSPVSVPPPVEEEPRALVGGPVSHGGFGGPSLAYARVRGEDGLFLGGRGGWIAGHRLVLGGGGYGLVNRVAPPEGATAVTADYRMSFGYGGLWLEYIIMPMSVVHASVGTLVGGGGVSYHRWHGHAAGAENQSDTVFVAEPTVALEVNLTRFMRLALEGRYRMVGGVDLVGLDAGDLRGFAFGTLLKFGKF
jgi:hypothetical protein